jgi:hypothetical protein
LCHCSCVDGAGECFMPPAQSANIGGSINVLPIGLCSRCHDVSKFLTRVNQKYLFLSPHD